MSSVRDAEEEPLIAALPLLYRLVLASANPKRLGLTKTQLIIMLSLAHFGTLRMSQIADFISSSKEQATRAVAPLAEEGYVCRSNDPENRTYIEIRLTQAGRAFMDQWHCSLLDQLNSRLDRDITDGERDELRQASMSIVRILSKLR